jgi:hypothetical protein
MPTNKPDRRVNILGEILRDYMWMQDVTWSELWAMEDGEGKRGQGTEEIVQESGENS